MEITLLLNNPPGGRCRLYRAYAIALAEHASIPHMEWFDTLPTQPQLRAPAMLIDGLLVAAADGVILAPQDIGQRLALPPPDRERLEQTLEAVLEKFMQEWS